MTIGPGWTPRQRSAASVHPDAWHVVTGRPYVPRPMGAGLSKRENPIPPPSPGYLAIRSRWFAATAFLTVTLPSGQRTDSSSTSWAVPRPKCALAGFCEM